MSLFTKDYQVDAVRLECSYCERAMFFTTERIKRPVPQGSKDMDIYDEVSLWRCTGCDQTSTDFLTNCKNCDSKVVAFQVDTNGERNNMKKLSPLLNNGTISSGYPKISGFFLDEGYDLTDKQPDLCLNCLTCYECDQQIYDESFYKQPPYRQVFNAIFSAKTDSNAAIIWFKYFYFHKDCFEKSALYKSYQDETPTKEQSKGKGAGCTAMLAVIVAVLGLLLTSLVAVVSAVSSSNAH